MDTARRRQKTKCLCEGGAVNWKCILLNISKSHLPQQKVQRPSITKNNNTRTNWRALCVTLLFAYHHSYATIRPWSSKGRDADGHHEWITVPTNVWHQSVCGFKASNWLTPQIGYPYPKGFTKCGSNALVASIDDAALVAFGVSTSATISLWFMGERNINNNNNYY